jgi:hypothetical protein
MGKNHLCEEEPLCTLLNSAASLKSQCSQRLEEKPEQKGGRMNQLSINRVLQKLMTNKKICLIFAFHEY